jgi:hypothetical protein
MPRTVLGLLAVLCLLASGCKSPCPFCESPIAKSVAAIHSLTL